MNYTNIKNRIDSIFEKYIVGRITLLFLMFSPFLWYKISVFDSNVNPNLPLVWLSSLGMFLFLIYSYFVENEKYWKVYNYVLYLYTLVLVLIVYQLDFAQFPVFFMWLNFVVISLTINDRPVLLGYFLFFFLIVNVFTYLTGIPLQFDFPYFGHFLVLIVCAMVGLNRMKMIEDFKNYEHKLNRKNEEINLFLQTISAMVCVKDDANNIVMANQAHATFTGVPLEALEGKNLSAFLPEEAAKKCLVEDLKIIESNLPIMGKIEQYAGKEGDLRWLRMNQIPYQSKRNKDRGIIIITEDITEEIETKKQSETNLTMFRKAFDNAPLPIVLTNFSAERKPVDINNAACQVFGYTREEFLSKNGLEVSYREDVDISAFHLANSSKDKKDVFQYKKRYVKKSGEVFNAEVITTVIRDGNGNELMLLCMLRDITKELESEAIRLKYAEDLEKSNQELEEFAYVVSHDLREPLRMITSYIQLIKRRYIEKIDDTAAIEFMDYVTSGAKRMDHLIQDILEYSRVGRMNKDTSIVNMDEVFFTVVQNLRTVINERKAEIVVSKLYDVQGNETMITELLQNLISNSLKYCAEDKRPMIEVHQENNDTHTLISVKDNGIGIEKEHQDLIFAVFQRLHTREEYSGTGIGLALCKKIVDNMGGRIWVESELNMGSTFFVSIPFAEHSQE